MAAAQVVRQQAAQADSQQGAEEKMLYVGAGGKAPAPRKQLLKQGAQAQLPAAPAAARNYDPAEIAKLAAEWLKAYVPGLGTDQDLGEVTQAIVEHFLYAFPTSNVMVVSPPHIASFEESAHVDINVPYDYVLYRHYDVYIFKSGSFTLLGDGGYANWCFGGNFERHGKHVIFYQR